MLATKATTDIYELIIEKALSQPAIIESFALGLTWSYTSANIEGSSSMGFAMSPMEYTRTLEWPGSVAGQSCSEFIPWLTSWDPHKTTLAMSCCNAVINTSSNDLLNKSNPIEFEFSGNLAVFEYFKPQLKGKKIAVIGRYPGIDEVLEGIDYRVLERNPGSGDLPDTAAEKILPQSDWVFITATTLLNKSFERLSQLSEKAISVLMGPTTPWLKEFDNYDIDFIAGVSTQNISMAQKIIVEGGGKRLFDGGVQYRIANISEKRLKKLEQAIALTAADRIATRSDMDEWYQNNPNKRFPKWLELEQLDSKLSKLDTAYKLLWDVNQVVR